MFAWLGRLIRRLLSAALARRAEPVVLRIELDPGGARRSRPPDDRPPSRDDKRSELIDAIDGDSSGDFWWPPPRGPLRPPADPYSSVRHPKSRRPGGDSASVSVAEPDEPETIIAKGPRSR